MPVSRRRKKRPPLGQVVPALVQQTRCGFLHDACPKPATLFVGGLADHPENPNLSALAGTPSCAEHAAAILADVPADHHDVRITPLAVAVRFYVEMMGRVPSGWPRLR